MVADLRTAIVDTARQLGISPVDLATVISYETAGTFDPAKAGPRTQWGQHRGLIQWGEPQAQKYGVDFADPAKQMQAVAHYLTDAGVKPGMGLLDVYSAVNAGRVGRYNASDANNGGAPGTVRDKVEKQMEGHKAKAAALVGGEYAPTVTASAEPAQAPAALPVPGAIAPDQPGILAAMQPAAEPQQPQANTPSMIMALLQRQQAAADQDAQSQQQTLDALAAQRRAWAAQNGWSA